MMLKRVLLFTSLAEVLTQIDTLPIYRRCTYTFYVPRNTALLHETTPCAVLVTTEGAARGYLPPFARRHDLEAIVDGGIVREVVDHACGRNPAVTGRDLVTALAYYLENDAFFDSAEQGA